MTHMARTKPYAEFVLEKKELAHLRLAELPKALNEDDAKFKAILASMEEEDAKHRGNLGGDRVMLDDVPAHVEEKWWKERAAAACKKAGVDVRLFLKWIDDSLPEGAVHEYKGTTSSSGPDPDEYEGEELKAYEEGESARKGDDNPYDKGDSLYQAWDDGYASNHNHKK